MPALLLILLLAASAADAVLIATETVNNTPPPDDPGWAYVGTRGGGLNGNTLIYLGNGWVLTADHVGMADLRLGGVDYPQVPGSEVQFQNADMSLADLIVFRIEGNPDLPNLPILEIVQTSPAMGSPVTMIGRGQNRGGAGTWFEPPSGPLREGWAWGVGASIRWGTNLIADPMLAPPSGTDSLISDFTKPGDPGFTSEEAQGALGDSGGAVFHKVGSEWLLAGVIHARGEYPGQPAGTALDGNITYFADLAGFRSQIIPLVRPQCSDEVDNDGDGDIDYPNDPNCPDAEWGDERPQCMDGLDNDADGDTDYPADQQCLSANSADEAATLPSLSPIGLVLLALALGVGAIRSRLRGLHDAG